MKKGLLSVLLILIMTLSAFVGCTYVPEKIDDTPEPEGPEYVGNLVEQDFDDALEAYQFGESFFNEEAEFYETTQRGIADAMSFKTYVLTKRYKSDATENFLYETNTYSGMSNPDPTFGLKTYKDADNDTIYYLRVQGKYNASTRPEGTKIDETYSTSNFTGSSSDFAGLTTLTKADWNSYKTDIGGNLPENLTIYKINESTIDESKTVFKKNEGGYAYQFTFELNSGAVEDYKNQVELYSLQTWKEFRTLKISFKMDKYGRIDQVNVDERYAVDAGAASAEVANTSVEYISYNKRPEIDYLDGTTIKGTNITYAELPETEAPVETYTISFDTGDGDEITDTILAYYNSEVGELPEPTYSQGLAHFMGWYSQPNGKGELYTSKTNYTQKTDVTLYAYWYFIDAQGGQYELTDDGEAYILKGIGANIYGTFTIPNEYLGKPVVAVADGAMQNDRTVNAVVIGDNIEVIGVGAFSGTNIKLVMTSNDSKLRRIENRAFQTGSTPSTTSALVYILLPASLEYIGDEAFSGCTNLTQLVIPSKVTEIGLKAFYNCINLYANFASNPTLERIGASAFENSNIQFAHEYYDETLEKNVAISKLPNSVKEIGDYAFYKCSIITPNPFLPLFELSTALEEIPIYAFSNIKSASGDDSLYVRFGKNTKVKTIGANAFNGSSIVSINLHEGIEEIGASAFSGCSKLQYGDIVVDYMAIMDSFYGSSFVDFTLPSSITTIGGTAFKGTTALKKLTFIGESKLEEISANLFEGSGVEKLVLGKHVASIAANAFKSCASLTVLIIDSAEVTLANINAFTGVNANLKIYVPANSLAAYQAATNWSNATIKARLVGVEVDNNVFYIDDYKTVLGVRHVISGVIELHADVEEIVAEAFLKCTEITAITIGDNITLIGANAFEGCTKLATVTIGDGALEIGSYAFAGCTSLTTVTIGDGISLIGSYAFRDCTKLEAITIGDSLSEIGAYAFGGCTSLTEIALGQSLGRINANAFNGCSSLSSITIEATVVPTLANANAITGTHAELKIYVPADSLSAYKAATNWKNATVVNKIFEITN